MMRTKWRWICACILLLFLLFLTTFTMQKRGHEIYSHQEANLDEEDHSKIHVAHKPTTGAGRKRKPDKKYSNSEEENTDKIDWVSIRKRLQRRRKIFAFANEIASEDESESAETPDRKTGIGLDKKRRYESSDNVFKEPPTTSVPKNVVSTAAMKGEQRVVNTHRKNEPTIVTALFDIGRGNWSLYRRDYTEYMHYMTRLLLLDIQLIVYADADGARYVKDHRRDKMRKTIVREMTLQQLPLYTYYGRMKAVLDREQANWRPEWDESMRTHPECLSAEYDILMNSKPYLVHYAANWNPFGSEYFYWLDAGYGHGQAPYPPAGSYWAPENLMPPWSNVGEKITFIQLTVSENMKGETLQSMYRQGVAYVNGGFFGGGQSAVARYYTLHLQIFEKLLNDGYVDDDQTLTVLCYKENTDLFNMVTGDWYDVFALFHLKQQKKNQS